MDYTLPDGTRIELANILEVSDIKDYGQDEKTIDECTLSFTIRMISGHSIRITRNYNYNEWFEKFKELKVIRNAIIEHWERVKTDKS